MFFKLIRQRSARSTVVASDSPTENASVFAAVVDVEQRTGVRVALPCTAGNDGSDAVCHVFEELSSWNRYLWHLGLQLRELTVPGELSLVQVHDQGCGHEHKARSRDGRLLFHALLTRHRCLVSLDLDEAIIEGGELCECRNLVVRALQQNSTLRKLRLGGFGDYDFIRHEIFAAITEKPHLQELAFVGSGPVLGVVDTLRTILVDSAANISTLSIPAIRFDEENARRLVGALKRHDALQELSVHVSILRSLFPSGTARFSRYLATCVRLRVLTVTDDVDRKTAAYDEVSSIVAGLVSGGSIQRLELLGFLLDENCAYLFSWLLVRSGALESLDIIGCQWVPVAPVRSDCTMPPRENEFDLRNEGQAFSRRVRPWVQAFSDNRTLKSFAINLGGLTAADFGVFFQALIAVDSLSTVFVSGVAPEDLPQVGRLIRDTGMCGRVSVREQYFVSPALLNALVGCPEVLRHVVVSAAKAPNADVCREMLLQLTTSCWCKVTTLRLLLSQEVLDPVTAQAMRRYLSEATALKELELGGCKEPDLSLLKGEGSLNPLLVALFSSRSVRTLHIWRFRFGLVNLQFLAQAAVTSRRLCEFCFSSCDSAENATLLRILARDLAVNESMLHLRAYTSIQVETQADRFIIEDVLGRNMGLVTCAAQFVVKGTRSVRCVDALHRVRESSALISKVQELVSVNEDEAAALIQACQP